MRDEPIYVRGFTAGDYDTLRSWWRGHDSAPPPLNLIPAGSSFLACRDGEPLAFSQVWLANADVSIIGLTICNPSLRATLRYTATMAVLKRVIEAAKAHAGEFGCVWSCTDNPGLVKMYERLGFTNAGEASTFHMALGSFNPEFLE